MSYSRCSSITLRQLQIFAAVGRAESFARAADQLNLSQPAVSDQIKALELLLGVRLVVRSPGRRQVELSEPGLVLLSAWNEVSQALERADSALEAFRGLERGTVAFGASLCFGGYILPRVHSDFRQRYPGITVHHEVEPVSWLLGSVREGRLDLAVVVGPVDEAGLLVEPLGGYDILLVGPPGHRLARGGPFPCAELASEQMILPRSTFILRRLVDRIAARAGVTLRVAMEVSHIEAKVQAVVGGVGIAPVGSYGAAARIAAGQLALLQVEGFPIRLDWCIASRRGELSPPAQAFKEHLLSYRSSLEDNSFPGCLPRVLAS